MRRLLAAIVVGTLALALPACGNSTEVGRAAGITPREAIALVSVNLAPSIQQKRHLQGIIDKFPGIPALVRGEFENARDQLLTELVKTAGLDFDKDVKPWLGDEVALVVLPATNDGSPAAAVLIESKDEDAANAAMAKAKANQDFAGEYRVLGEYVVVTDQDSPEANGTLLDMFAATAEKAGSGLAGDDRFANVVAELPDERLVLAWADTKEAMRTAEVLGAGDPFFGADLGGFVGSGPVAFDLHAARSALVVEGAAVNGDTKGGRGEPTIARNLPAETLGALTLFNVGDTLLKALGAVAGTEADMIAEFEASAGINIRTDVLSWMKGQTVLVAGPVPPGQDFPDFAMIIEPTDEAPARRGVEALRTALSKYGTVATREIAGATAYVTEAPIAPGIQPAMALFPGRFVVASRPEYLAAVATPASPDLGGTRGYQSVVGDGSADDTSAQFVLLVDPIREAFESTMSPEERAGYERDIKPNLEPLSAVGMVATQDDRFTHIELRVTFD